MAIGHINGVAALTGSSCEKMYGCFTAGTKRTSRTNKVTIRRGSTVYMHKCLTLFVELALDQLL